MTQAQAESLPSRAAREWSSQNAGPGDDPKPADRLLSVPEHQRTTVLGKDYHSSRDQAFTSSGDGTGFHLMVAEERMGYQWKTAATLSEPGFEADTWIGNVCLTESGKYAAVAYAPRTFTNKSELMSRGAFTAIVNLEDGDVRKLPFQATLGYFSPGCGKGENAVFSQFSDEETSKKSQTRLVTVDAGSGSTAEATIAGQVTSAVPVDGHIVAARGRQIVKINGSAVQTIADTHATPFQLKTDADGGVTFIDRLPGEKKQSSDDQAAVSRVTSEAVRKADGRARAAELARGELTRFDLARTPAGTVYVTGQARSSGKLPGTVRNPGGIEKDARISSRAAAAVTTTWADGKDSRVQQDSLSPRAARISLKALDTGKSAVLEATPGDRIGSISAQRAGRAMSPALPKPAEHAAPGARTGSNGGDSKLAKLVGDNPVDADRTCAVPRNDPKKQAFQPTPRQVEWAVDQAIVGRLNKGATRSANWKDTGMPAYGPQSLFPLRSLNGGSGEDWHIPAQVMLGITAQESNMWQAKGYVVPGVTGNPLIGNYYGTKYASNGQQPDPWAIDWSKADCGYGVTQVTDGMRLPGKGQPAMSATQQEAVALDYAANVASGVNILVEKWNQTRADGIVINDGHPKFIENWFAALWSYNTGYHPKSEANNNSGKWGLGWTNNPANPLWKENRTPFLENSAGLDDYSHAAHPQDWPYEEKVIGWAARPISAMFKPGEMAAGYRPAWWTKPAYRTTAKPPIGLFCDSSNDCDPSKIGTNASNNTGNGPCLLPGDPNDSDPLYLKCWSTKPAKWKDCTSTAQCGSAIHRFNDTFPEQPDADSYPPRCTAGLPSGTYVIDDLPDGFLPTGSDSHSCGTISSAGSFTFAFGGPQTRMDLHQIGAAYGNHFWFSHTNRAGTPDAQRLLTTGKWTLNKPARGWMRVWVHLPDHGAHTRQAAYVIEGTDSTSPKRVKPQRVLENKWVSLGAFNFTGTPSVSLSNVTADGKQEEDVAWDATGFEPLNGKPKNQIVAMGDSYSSGEGASDKGGEDYYPESDYYDKVQPATENKCHRSKYAWSRQATLPGYLKPIGQMADDRDSDMDYQFIACSGARHYNIVREGQFGELSQIEQGYLDQNTTLVTLSVGGNDARFTDVVTKCFASEPCSAESIGGVDPDTGKGNGQETGPLKEWAPKWLHDQVRPRLTSTLNEIHQHAPKAKIVLMGYPRLLESPKLCLPAIGPDEGPWLNQLADTAADEMRGAVEDANKQHSANVVFADPRAEFTGKAICGNPESVNGLVLSGHSQADNRDWKWLPGNIAPSMKSFHPKISGARLYANVLEQALRN
ncbi:GDSL-type esterase/lipase family protein (plasmid) [Streptomyces sp. HU2014]|uniref:GDSL-type esterase/lipase family protein n=1 Tax=Streptomyces sp. HU2014 TaxID=2939414 RepID=UPI00200EFFCF|nr:GDSL-type esterase/lipase family protein [Streptomyces sp. HU2014]UQI49729.1 GDSL-type esterase/lipase family protein [Streptomyces sp. HU2014]